LGEVQSESCHPWRPQSLREGSRDVNCYCVVPLLEKAEGECISSLAHFIPCPHARCGKRMPGTERGDSLRSSELDRTDTPGKRSA